MSVSSSDDEEQYRLPALPPVEDDEPETLDEVKERLKEVAEHLKRTDLSHQDREDAEIYEEDLKDKLFALTPAMPYREWKAELSRLWELRLKTSPSKQPKELYAIKKQIEAHEGVKHYAIRPGQHEGKLLASVSPPPELAEPTQYEVTMKQIAAEKANPKKFVFKKKVNMYADMAPSAFEVKEGDPFPFHNYEEAPSDDEAPPGLAQRLVHSFYKSHPPVKRGAKDFMGGK